MRRRNFLRHAAATTPAWLTACSPVVALTPQPSPEVLLSASPTNRSTQPVAASTPTLVPSNVSPTKTPVPVLTTPVSRLGRLTLLRSGFPRAYFFRLSEGQAADPKISYDSWEKTFSRLMGIEGKVLEEEVPGRSIRNIDFFSRFKKAHPEQLVLLHYNGNSRDPNSDCQRFFAGHWLYFNGSKITADLPAQSGDMDIPVTDATLFRVNIGRDGTSNEDVGLCELDAAGKPNWLVSEQVQLISTNPAKKTIRVRRGSFGTSPRPFSAQKAYAAAHVTEGPWGKKSALLWSYNYALDCPRDARGQQCLEVLAEDLGEKFLPGGILTDFDGVQFDVLFHTAGPRTVGKRGADANSDTRADNGYMDGVNSYGKGVIEFIRRLRKVMGDDRLIMADGFMENNQRAFGLLNGIESEGWPSLNDIEIDDWSGGVNRQRYWGTRLQPPAFHYVNHKFMQKSTTGVAADTQQAEVPFSTHRLVLAAAVGMQAAICWSYSLPVAKDGSVGVWDELWKGMEHQQAWLGQPKSEMVFVGEQQTDLLDGIGNLPGADLLKRLKGEGIAITLDGQAVQISANKPDLAEMRLQLTGIPRPSADLLVTFVASAAVDPTAGCEERLLRLRFNGQDSKGSHCWVGKNTFSYRHYQSGLKGGAVDLELVMEGSAPWWLYRVNAYAGSDAFYRLFDGGLVLANPSRQPYRFDLEKWFPGQHWRRIQGSPEQDPQVNNGQPVSGSVLLGARDGLFLIREK